MAEAKIRLSLDGQAQVIAGIQGVERQLGGIGRGAQASAQSTESLTAALARVGHYGIAGGALYGVAQSAAAIGRATFEASASAQRLATQLNFATAGQGARELAFASDVAQRLGLNMVSTAQAYAGFASAARGTALEGAAARDVFEGIAKASAVMGLSSDQTSGALLAVQQMMSKGVVSAEEFRGQLGERMPIALQAGAQALGVTTAEFSKMLESGQIIAQDFLPKFSRAITEMLGDSVDQAANRLDAATARMGNAWTRLMQTVGDSGLSRAMASEATAISQYMDTISDSMRRAEGAGQGMAGQLLSGLGQVIARAPFDVLAGSANLLNGTINALTFGAARLNTNINLLPDALKSSAQQSLALERDLKAAKAELATLQDQAEKKGAGLYLKSAIGDVQRYIDKLEEARKKQTALDPVGGGRGTINPPTVGQMEQAAAKRAADLLEVKQKLYNVDKDYLPTLNKLHEAYQAGDMTLSEYQDSVGRLAEKNYKAEKSTKDSAKAARDAAAEHEKLERAYDSLLSSVNEKIAVQKIEIDGGRKASESDKLLIKFTEDLKDKYKELAPEKRRVIEAAIAEVAANERVIKSTLAMVDAYRQTVEFTQEVEAAESAAFKTREQIMLSTDAYGASIRTANEMIALEQSLFGKSEQGRAIAIGQYQIELDLKKQIEAINNRDAASSQEWRDEQIAKVTASAEEAKRGLAAKANLTEMQRLMGTFDNTAHDVFVNLFNDGSNAFKKLGQSLKAGLIDVLYQMTLKKWVFNIVGSVTGGGVAGAANAATSGLSGGSNLLSTGSSIYQLGSSVAGGMSMANATGSMLANATGAGLDGLLAINGAYGTASGMAGAMAPVLQGLMTAAPYLAAVAAVYMIAKSLDKSGTPHSGGGSAYSAASGLSSTPVGGWTGGTTWGDGFGSVVGKQDTTDMTAKLTQSIVGILDSTATAFGKSAGYMAATSFADDSSKDPAWGSLVIKQMDNVLVNWADTRSSKWAPRTFSDGSAGSAEYLAAISADVRTALEGIGLPAWATTMLDGLGEAPALDQLANTVALINKTQAVFASLGQAMQGFAAIGDAGKGQLVAAAGGIDALGASASAYYQAMYTEEEKAATVKRQYTAALQAVNQAVPASITAYRDQVAYLESIVDTEPGAAAALATMYAMGPAFASVNQPAADLVSTVVDTAEEVATLEQALAALRNPMRTIEDIAQSIVSLERTGAALNVDLLSAQGDAAGAAALRRSLDTAGFTEAELALYDYNQALREQIAAVESASQALQESSERERANAERVAAERTSLQDQLDQLTLTETQLLDKQRNALDESNRALFDHVRAAYAAAEAERALAEQTQRVAAERTSLQDQLDRLTLTETQLLDKQRNALDESNRALFDQIQAVTASIKANEAEQAAREQAARAAEHIASELAQATRRAAEEAARAAQQIASEHVGLWRQWLTLNEDTAALRALDLAALDPSNRALQEQIWMLEDQKKTLDEQQKAADQAAAAAEQMKSAWASLTDSMLDEVRRIRGLIGENSGAGYASLQAQFAIATAQTRAGDQEAAKLLPGLSQGLLSAYESTATTLVDLQRLRALTANSLEQTATLVAGGTGTVAPVVETSGGRSRGTAAGINRDTTYTVTPAAPTYGLADMVVELRGEIAALKGEVKGLRDEAKATSETIAINTGKSARLAQKWDDIGLPITTETDLAAVYGA